MLALLFPAVQVSAATPSTIPVYPGCGEVRVLTLFELQFPESPDLLHSDSRERASWPRITRKTYSKSAANPAPGQSELNARPIRDRSHDSNLSQTSPWGHRSQVFRTNAPVNEVVAFYEHALNRKALKGEPAAGGETWYFLAYSPQSEPDDHLTIEDDGRPGQPGSFKTRIIFTIDRFKDDPVK